MLHPKINKFEPYSLNSDINLNEIGKDVIKFAESEELTAHANSVKVRFNDG